MHTGKLQELAQTLSRHGEKEVRDLAQGTLTLIAIFRHTENKALKSADEIRALKKRAKDGTK